MRAELQFDGGYTPESWEYARAFVGALGPLPSTFTSVIRLLLSDYEKNPAELSQYGRFFTGRLLKAQAIQAPYFYALRYFKPLSIPKGEPFTVRHFLESYSGFEHACMLGLILFHRHCHRVCGASEHFDQIIPRLQRGLNLGWLVGNALPTVGAGPGMLVGAIRVLGLAPFVKHDPEGFKQYQKYLTTNRIGVDIDYEFQRWQCNSLQVGLIICQQLGFGISRVVPLLRAITTTSPLLQRDEDERAYRVVDVWIESLLVSKSAPSIPLPPKYYPGARELDALLQMASTQLNSGEAAWLTRGKNDLSREKTPEIFIGVPEADDGVPSELEEALPEEAINELSTKLLTDLLNPDEEGDQA